MSNITDLAEALFVYLDRSRKGLSTQRLWDHAKSLDLSPTGHEFDTALKFLRDDGRVAVANDCWFIRGRKYKPREKRQRKPTLKEMQFRQKQGRLL
jgi:hypothetical protein